MIGVRALAFCAFGLVAGVSVAAGATWTRIDGPKVTVVSEAPAWVTRDWAVEIEQFHQALGTVLPLNENRVRPVNIIIFSTDSHFRPYKILENGKPAAVSGYQVDSEMGNFIGLSEGDFSDDTRRVILHECVHWLTHSDGAYIPLWLDEGMAEVFSTFTIDGDHFSYGTAIPWHVDLLRERTMLPIRELVTLSPRSLLYNERLRTGIFYAESWALVHYLLFSKQYAQTGKLRELMQALQPGTDPDSAFRKVFGTDCKGMDLQLRIYLQAGNFSHSRLPFPRGQLEASAVARHASDAEVEFAKCSLLVATNQPERALLRLPPLLKALPSNPDVWTVAGFAAFRFKDYDSASQYFRHAAALGSDNPFVYAALGDATLGLRPDMLQPTSTSSDDVRNADDDYEHALSLDSRDEHAYENIALTVQFLDPALPGDRQILAQGHRFFPDNVGIRLGLAALRLKAGDESAVAEIRDIAEHSPPSAGIAAANAQQVLDNHQFEALVVHINDLWQQRDFRGVIAAVDEAQKMNLDPTTLNSVVQFGQQAQISIKLDDGIALAERGDFDGAQRLIESQLKAPGLDSDLRSEIVRILAQIDKVKSKAAAAASQ